MDEARVQALDVRSLATDKLVKAMLALVEYQDSEVGQAPRGVWLELRHEMQVLRDLARAEDAVGSA